MKNKNRIDSAVLLAAGLGTRLSPLTLKTPKPLLNLDGCTLIDHQLRYLKKNGFKTVAINIHHLPEMIKNHVGDGSRYGLSILYSRETHILGTGGGIKKACGYLSSDNVLVLNSDILINLNLEKFVERHLLSNAIATMALRKLLPGENYTGISVDTDGFVSSIGDGSYSFTGIHIVGKTLLESLPPAGSESCVISDGYKKILSGGGKIASAIHHGYWKDIGTHASLKEAEEDISRGKFEMIKE
ncbi:MAG TPA: nucleotidyltransferase family protein [bacterium]|nr:nucleotidyltransferase family protein [Myxococcales bacterium]OQA62058.1 MAG: D-glycero-alpha-D-manno-heptose 1-phosphate guanylyltransferase [bacterium ADurb.Bin270]HPW45198.1 nucleotidyltransferase family protein [bacterium]HQC50408.1 nucleotidyltransferase family protein [bacterium]HQG13746.1 nucleotidyltransferase family protein [bacterium]